MKKFESNLSLGQYKAKESFWYFDELSEEERVLAYRLGWKIFDQNKMFFKNFSSFHKRKVFILQILGYLIATILFLSVFFIILLHPSALKYALGVFVLAGSIMTFIVTVAKARKNLRETKPFFNYMDPTNKPLNHKAFLNLELNDFEGAEEFYLNLRTGKDYEFVPAERKGNNYNLFESILMLEILFQAELIGGNSVNGEKINGLRPFLSKRISTQDDWEEYLAKMFKCSTDNVKKVYPKVDNLLKSLENKNYRQQKAKEIKDIIFMCKENGLKSEFLNKLSKTMDN
ncbi:hypothetical protein [Algoriphagus aquimarinus]|uniref:hypothetical protein n=1 Tax=Algoriphagus aquimarinus TaxID=237018 RepID=UPI0030DC3EC5|tara:strand:- start:243505 stop:244365 length:861 start_codon:yes stop_codon:yes gene_type:complete